MYKMNDVALIRTTEQKCLGIMLTSDLRWNTHISNIASKANRSLGLVKRRLHMCQQDAKELAYTSIVRSHLEYASSAWDLHTSSSSTAKEHCLSGHILTATSINWKQYSIERTAV